MRDCLYSTLMIFLDGVGIGESNREKNPFFKYGFNAFEKIFGDIPSLENQRLISEDKFLFPVDATLGIEGFPQSGTGQTSIFCGVNASQILGRHFGPYPHSELFPTLKEKNIFQAFLDKGLRPKFANAYPRIFFDYIKKGRRTLSATSTSYMMAGLRLNTGVDLRRGNALSAEIDNYRWRHKLNYKISEIAPELAAKRLLKLAKNHNFTMYEYYLTDHFGHGRSLERINEDYENLDRFLYYILTNLDRENISLIICSDHGNFEDVSIKTHTYNPSLCITAGKNSKKLMERINDLSDIKPAIMDLIE